MAPWRVPLADLALSEEDIVAVSDAYRSGWLSMGPRTAAFEQAFADFTGAGHALAVASGTAALHLMCLAAGLGSGDEVIVPSLTFVASINAIAYTGATPVFADIAGITEPWLSSSAAQAAITPRTKAIMGVAYGGHPGEMGSLARLAARSGLVLLEDAAHAAGARAAGRHLGTFGLCGAFSFFSNKNLAVGEGGALVTDDPGVAAQVRLMRSHGMTSLSWDRHLGHASSYDVVALGFNYRLDEPRAALLLSRLAKLPSGVARRRELTRAYRERLADVPGVIVPYDDASVEHSTCYVLPILLEDASRRNDVRTTLRDGGVQTSIFYPAVHEFTAYRERFGTPSLPHSEYVARAEITLPLHLDMDEAVIDRVVTALAEALR
jgi:dTDP-4-amino-4,6-dideoxygalactose transaminase